MAISASTNGMPMESTTHAEGADPATSTIPFDDQGPWLPAEFAYCARRYADRTAVSAAGRQLSYRELDEASARIARALLDRGIGRGSLVAVCTGRDTALVSVLLGILRSGAAYLPLDPAHPVDRRDYILRDSGACLMITDEARTRDRPTSVGQPGPPVAGVVDLLAGSRAEPFAVAPLVGADAAYTIYTSGSTGRPKGVTVSHAALANLLHSMGHRPGLPAGSVLVAVTTISFDIAGLELFLPLLTGGTVALATRAQASDPRQLAELLDTSGSAMMQATPATWRLLKQVGWSPPPGFTILCGGERMPADLARWFGTIDADAWDLYGPTETTIWSTAELLGRAGVPAQWQPVANTSLHVLDEELRPVPTGRTGEVYIGGAGLATCYRGRPALTASRFLPNPFGAGRLYRTGDLGRFDPGRGLVIVGRSDDQIKIRGYRVELGEIEAVATRQPGIAAAAACGQPDPTGGQRLLLYVVPQHPGRAVDAGQLRSALAGTLPDYMVPARIIVVAELLLTPNGKVDRARLSASAIEPARPRVTVDDETERTLLRLWEHVLGDMPDSPDADFLAMGGHSLAAASLAIRIRQALSVEISPAQLLRYRTVAQQARLVDAATRIRSTEQADPAPPDDGSAGLPLTSAQHRVLFTERMQRADASYLITSVHLVDGPLELAAFDRAVQAVASRQEALRLRIDPDGPHPSQRIDPDTSIPVTVRPVTSRAEAIAIATTEISRPFRLPAELPTRVLVLPGPADTAVVAFSWHHLVFDGWSTGVFFAELEAAYADALAGRPQPSAGQSRYPAAVRAYQRRLESAATSEQLDYWQKALAGSPTLCSFPTDWPRPAQRSGTGSLISRQLGSAVSQRFRALCRAAGYTSFTGLVTLLAYQLGRYDERTDVVIGSPVTGRASSETESAVGLFANTVTLRVNLAEASSFGELADQVRDRVYEALDHSDVPFERVVEALRPDRSQSHSPLFQVLFNLESPDRDQLRLASTRATRIPVGTGGAAYDFALTVLDDGLGAFGLEAEYATELYDRATVEALLSHYAQLVDRVSAAEVDSPLTDAFAAGEAELALIDEWNAARTTVGRDETVSGLVAVQAAATPDRPAVTGRSQTISYARLVDLAGRVTGALARSGVGAGQLVGVCVSGDLGLPVALLGILQTGAGYLPLDPGYPRNRLAAILDQATPIAIVVDRRSAERLPAGDWKLLTIGDDGIVEGGTGPVPPAAVHPGALAYVIHTSGSTGTPKGVCMPHSSLVNLIRWQARAQLSGRRTAQLASIGFDVHFQEIFITLASGGQVMLAAPEIRRDPQQLLQWLHDAEVAQLICTPTMLEALAGAARRADTVPGSLLEITAAGEQLRLSADVCWLLHTTGALLHNQYGPSETHAATAYPVPDLGRDGAPPRDSRPPIGRPIDNKQVHVLDDDLQRLPPGVVGELYIAGIGLADGYLGKPAETAARFLPDPFSGVPGARMYRTGDCGRWQPAGVLRHLGRTDGQLKIRGVRVESAEIELLLSRYPGVRAAAVAIREPVPGDPVLVAYLVPAAGGGPDPEQLRDHLAAHLPEYALPSRYLTLAELPLTASGKVARSALPTPAPVQSDDRASRAPRPGLETEIAELWRAGLGSGELGAEDNFFVLGGHSLLAARLVGELNQRLGTSLPVAELFRRPTIAGLAVAVGTATSTRRHHPLRRVVEHHPPLSVAQQRLWFLDQLTPGSTEFLLPVVLRLEGSLDEPALRGAVDSLCRRHDILRTRYPAHRGEPSAVIDPPGTVPMQRLDLDRLPPVDRGQLLGKLLEEELDTPFELATEHPVRVQLIRLAERDHLLVMTLHHIGADGRSLVLLRQELLRGYRDACEPADSADRPQYADFARWEQLELTDATLGPLVEYWRQALAGMRPLQLPTDSARPATWHGDGGLLRFTLPEPAFDTVAELARRHSTTPYMVLLTAFVLLLADASDQSEVVLGTPVSGRWHPEADTLVGSFADLLVLRFDLTGCGSFQQALVRVRDFTAEAFAHQELPFDHLVRALRPPRDPSRHPIVDVLFNFVEDNDPDPVIEDLTVTPLPLASQRAGLDIDLMVQRDRQGRLSCELVYASALFSESRARELAAGYWSHLAAALPDAEPGLPPRVAIHRPATSIDFPPGG